MLGELVEHGLPLPIEFGPSGTVELADWYPSIEAENVTVEEEEIDGVACYAIKRELFGDFTSSWRRQVLLSRGNYEFEARVRTDAVVPMPEDQGRGAGIRRSQSGRSMELVGTSGWTRVTYPIEIRDQRMVELMLELRARFGKAWFDRESIKIRQVVRGRQSSTE